MSINLCNTIFGVTMSSSTVSTEGYELENLLHRGKQHIGRGFMAERFIKPPIDIVFSFPFKIEIKEIYLDPSVGNQVSCGFEIFTASLQDDKQTVECNFQSVGKSPWSNSKFSLYHFVNHRYNKKVDLRHHKRDEHHWTRKTCNQLSLSLRHQFSQFLIQVTHVKVKITRTHGSSIPCLKRLEIYGQPSYLCSQVQVNAFLDKVHTLHIQSDAGPSSLSENTSKILESANTDSSLGGSSSFQDEPLMPEEFKDPLTLDLMSLPVILPSGHTIDQTTLDKHTAAEAEWGRPPSDPFTGITFSDTSKPIPNLLLKSRVDKYILKAGKKFQHLARTTIGVSNHGLPDPKSHDRIAGRLQSDSHIIHNQSHNNQKSKMDPTMISKSDSIVLNMPNSKLKGPFRNSKLHNSLKRKTDVLAMTSPNEKRRAEDGQHHEDAVRNSLTSALTDGQHHEAAVRNSLTSALNATLTQLPSFQELQCHAESKRKKCQEQTTRSVFCNVCGNCPSDIEDGSPKHLYQFPCRHVYCRLCLLKSVSDSDRGQYKCSTCDLKVDSKDITRIHTITYVAKN